MCEPMIRVENLTKVFRSGDSDLVVLDGVDLEFPKGQSTALVGESGAGKTTLLHLLATLDRPSGGEIYFAGRSLSSRSEAELDHLRNREIGYVWQNYHLLPEFSALENIMMPLLIAGQSAQQAERAARDCIAEVGLARRASHGVGELSGGEQQRIAIARALVASPKLLLADEPTGNLDQKTGQAIIDLITSLPGSHGITAVIATHNLAFARSCDRVFRIGEGQIRLSDPGTALSS